jgi:hypothetical protein
MATHRKFVTGTPKRSAITASHAKYMRDSCGINARKTRSDKGKRRS